MSGKVPISPPSTLSTSRVCRSQQTTAKGSQGSRWCHLLSAGWKVTPKPVLSITSAPNMHAEPSVTWQPARSEQSIEYQDASHPLDSHLAYSEHELFLNHLNFNQNSRCFKIPAWAYNLAWDELSGFCSACQLKAPKWQISFFSAKYKRYDPKIRTSCLRWQGTTSM